MTHLPNVNLSKALLANAALSLVTGVLVAAFASQFALAFRLGSALLFYVFAIVLIVHSVILAAVHKRSNAHFWDKLNFLCIAPYPLLLVAYLLFGPDRPVWLSAIVAADALAVGLVALWHLVALRASRFAAIDQ
ncbi:MAG: hypothetical protein AAGG69_07945 [Pseudomonadota bacterium]